MTSESMLVFGRFQLDRTTGDLHDESGPLPLTPKALALLGYLAERPGRLITKRELLDAIWPGVHVADGALKVCVREIRRALGDDAHVPHFIETAHRRGYRFVAPVRQVPTASAPVTLPAPPVQETHQPIRVHYAHSGDVSIAYQILGSGPIDLVFVMGWVSHLEYFWREPHFARFLQRLASFSRLILFDKRGTGLSDPVTQMPTLEQRMDDVRAVLDAVGSRRTVLLGVSEGGPMCSLFAATYPNRTEALVMIGTYARRTRTPDYPWAPTDEEREIFCREILERWGGPVGIEERAPSMLDNPAFLDWWSTYLRMGASPAAAVALTRMNAQIDIRHILPNVRVPTLVMHRRGDRCLRVEEGRYVASLIPDARFVELPGEDHLPFVGDSEGLLDEIERFVQESRSPLESRHRVATVLCVTRTERPAKPAVVDGDELHTLVVAEAARSGAGPVQRANGRVIAIFDGPVRAIRCACAISAAAKSKGLAVRIGVHTGECDVLAGVARGLVADIGGRLAEFATAGEVLVSRTVVDLVAGSGLRFSDRGSHRLAEGVPAWRVYSVEQRG